MKSSSNSADVEIEREAPSPIGPVTAEDIEWGDGDGSESVSDILGFDFAQSAGVDRSGLNALINSVVVSHRRLPMLDAIFDRTTRRISTSLRQMTDENVEAMLDDVTTMRFGDYMNAHERSVLIGVMRSKTLETSGLFLTDADLVYTVVDLLLGGRRGAAGFAPETRGFTAIELALAQRMLWTLVQEFDSAFRPICDVGFALDRVETAPRFAMIAQNASVCVLAKFRVRIDDRWARAAIVLPHASIEPVREQLTRDFIGEPAAKDDGWRERLQDGLQHAEIGVHAVIAEREMTVGSLRAAKAGDFIAFPRTPGSLVELRVGNRAVAHGTAGRLGAQIAIRLTGVGRGAPHEAGDA